MKHKYTVIEGECNITLQPALHDLYNTDSGYSYGPVFAFIDPYAMHVDWSTFRTLANWKAKYTPKGTPLSKAEMWILFPNSNIPRLIGKDVKKDTTTEMARQVTGWFGTTAWKSIYVQVATENNHSQRGAKRSISNVIQIST